MGNSEGGLRIVENSDLLYEYNKNVRPAVISFSLGLDYPASCPNLLAGFIHIKPNDSFKQDSILTCTPLCLYVIRGCGTTKIADEGQVDWSEDDLLVVPYQTQALNHFAHEDTAFYYVHDEPLLKYLRAKPAEKAFTTTIFRSHVLREKVESIREKPGSEHANRLGTLIGNPDISETKSLTHTLWALMNVLPANSLQKPHRHNAVALDLVTYAPKGKCYTLIGYDLNEDGTIRSPTRLEWKSGSAFTTPLGMWHSHHNESTDEDAWILPMQDAGLSKLEILPNEIFFNIFSHLLWNDILTSFWLLNKRFNSLIYLNFSINNCGIIINKTSLSYKIFLSKLFPLISNCSSLINSIRHIHLDGTCPHSYDFFNKNHCIQNYPNLKSLILDQFYLSKVLINNLCFLITGRLNELTMILDDVFTVFELEKELLERAATQIRNQLMFKDLLCGIFSETCKLINLRLDIPCNQSYLIIHDCLSFSYHASIPRFFKEQYCCRKLRYVEIHLHYACFIEYIIEHARNIERLLVCLKTSWNRYQLSDLASEKFEQSNTISSNKKFRAEKLKYLILKSTVEYDGQLYYLKWFFNNLNSVEKIKIRLKIDGTCEKNPIIYGSIVDANFIRKYLMNDRIINLIHFDFYIVSKSYYERFVDQNTERAKILARIISMPIQLNYLRIENFQWLLHLVEYAFDELKENALSNVRYTEFSLPSCRRGTNESVHLGKYLVPFLSKHMPYLQTLCLWKPDDFPWSSIRPDFNRARYELLARQWSKSLKTVESINKHVTLFENDLSQLVEQLKQFVYLNIYGHIIDEKVEPYRLMIQKRFPNTYFSIEKSRFRLWI
ncbi:unnamed protein product [Rotaria sp. Silwood1]|nr:unnamed protein product [Rotaria sp. Silwood1]